MRVPIRDRRPPFVLRRPYVPVPDRAEGIGAQLFEGTGMLRQDALARGRYRRVPPRWETEFGRWEADFGVSRIVKALADDSDLRVTNQAVYEWLQGYAPRPARAMTLVELSGGRLPLEAIYERYREIRRSPGRAANRDTANLSRPNPPRRPRARVLCRPRERVPATPVFKRSQSHETTCQRRGRGMLGLQGSTQASPCHGRFEHYEHGNMVATWWQHGGNMVATC